MTRLPQELYQWLLIQFPSIYLPGVTLHFRNPWTGSDGLTWGRTVTLRPAYEQGLKSLHPVAVELLCHELIHVEQFTRAGRWWLLSYLWNHKEWEAAAYQRALELRAMWEQHLVG